MDELRPDQWHTSHDRCPDSEPPISILVEPQDLSGEGHAKRHEQEEHANNPGEFARILEGAEEKDLHHVNDHQSDHEIRAPAMKCADEPSERLLMVEGLEAVPRAIGSRDIDESEADAGDELQNHHGETGTSEDVGPTSGVLRHRMLHRLSNGLPQFEAKVEPLAEIFNQAHVHLRDLSADATLG